MGAPTNPNVFIIESLSLSDETNGRFEGLFLSQILKLAGKEPIYYYIRTVTELSHILNMFNDSNYRYLHISCHGNESSLRTTLTKINFEKFGNTISPCLNGKRLFISACNAVNLNLVKYIIPHSGCFSVIGPSEKIYFHDAAIVWASFYHLLFKKNNSMMKNLDIVETLRNIKSTFGVTLQYYYQSSKSNSSIGHYKI